MKKWIIGISMIVVALLVALIALIDGNDSTNVNIPATIQEVQAGITVIKTDTTSTAETK